MLHTDRTFIRPVEIKDNLSIFDYRSDEEDNVFQNWLPKNLEEVDRFIIEQSQRINTPRTWFQLAIEEKTSAEVIGDIGIHFIDEVNLQCEIGCTLNKRYHGKGFATEALDAVIRYLFDTLHKRRITASVDPRNEPSIRLMQRLGFRKEAHFIKSLHFKGEWVDDVIFAKLITD